MLNLKLGLKLGPRDAGPTMIHLGGITVNKKVMDKNSLNWNEYTITEKKWKEE